MEFKYEGSSLKSGTYKLTNTINGRIYIGSAKEFKSRWKHHERSLRKNKHSNRFLQADFNKCGTEAFVFEVIELIYGEQNKRLLAEQKLLDIHWDKNKLCYNLRKTVHETGTDYSRKPLLEKKERTSLPLKGRAIHPNTLARLLDKEKNPFSKIGAEHPKTGKIMPSSARKAISKALTGKEKSAEHCLNLSKALTGKSLNPSSIAKFRDGRRKGINNANSKKVIQYDLQGNVIKVWDLMSEAARETGTVLSRISRCCHGHNKAANGFVWRLVEADKTDLKVV